MMNTFVHMFICVGRKACSLVYVCICACASVCVWTQEWMPGASLNCSSLISGDRIFHSMWRVPTGFPDWPINFKKGQSPLDSYPEVTDAFTTPSFHMNDWIQTQIPLIQAFYWLGHLLTTNVFCFFYESNLLLFICKFTLSLSYSLCLCLILFM